MIFLGENPSLSHEDFEAWSGSHALPPRFQGQLCPKPIVLRLVKLGRVMFPTVLILCKLEKVVLNDYSTKLIL